MANPEPSVRYVRSIGLVSAKLPFGASPNGLTSCNLGLGLAQSCTQICFAKVYLAHIVLCFSRA